MFKKDILKNTIGCSFGTSRRSEIVSPNLKFTPGPGHYLTMNSAREAVLTDREQFKGQSIQIKSPKRLNSPSTVFGRE